MPILQRTKTSNTMERHTNMPKMHDRNIQQNKNRKRGENT